ncbi:MAG: amidase [Alphaproteobacteria bacterium]|nr:MAG: amidase [Alphaproteobacteria bacterium]
MAHPRSLGPAGTDPVGAFCRDVELYLPGAAEGPLAGLTFAAKDLFDVAGHRTGCGNPDWRATHGPAAHTAPAIERLRAAGATLVGRTITDELAYSLQGQNAHYGTPRNVNAPGRIPGGSSSGSAAAVAAGLVDFALGTDTGGSVRVPAALCGVMGLRPSHGRVPDQGVARLAASFDTVGWFARDPQVLAAVGAVLLGEDAAATPLGRVLIAEDAFALADPAVAEALRARAAGAPRLAAAAPVAVGGEDGFDRLFHCFRELQQREIWAELGSWIEATRPRFGAEIAARFEAARQMAARPASDAPARRRAFRDRMDALLGADGVLLLPAAATIAPRIDATPEQFLDYRDRTLRLTCLAGLAGLPQVTIPAGRVEGCPVALSLIGPRGSDRRLLALAAELSGPI